MSTAFSIDLPLSLGPMDEFGLIQAYFAGSPAAEQGNSLGHRQALGIGDDAALLAPNTAGPAACGDDRFFGGEPALPF